MVFLFIFSGYFINLKQKRIMKLINISQAKLTISLYVKDKMGHDNFIELKPGEFVFSPTNEKTRSVNFQGMKRNIGIEDIEKPEHLNYLTVYNNASNIKFKEEINTPLDNQKEKGPNNSDEEVEEKAYEGLEEIKKQVDEYAENKPTPKKPTSTRRRRKGPGRPKKRGPKPKKKAPGRPKGSKNKRK